MLWSMMCKTPVILLVVSLISTLVISLISAVLPKAVAIINRSSSKEISTNQKAQDHWTQVILRESLTILIATLVVLMVPVPEVCAK